MIGFHIDMNVARFRGDYLREWLRELSRLGYDTIIWEVENNVRWRTCPECASVEAFTVDEFRDIIDFSRSLNLEPIPLLQSFGHCEYVLKHQEYSHLSEIPGGIEQYCPSNPEVVTFLHKWIQEYVDAFGDIRYFHLGCDEARWLGNCPECRGFTSANSLEDLYIRHITDVAAPLLRKNIRPIVWADMILSNPSSASLLSKEFVLFDWMYDIHRGNGKVWLWGTGHITKESLPEKAREVFGRYLFPDGEKHSGEIETFYTADFLADKGFDVVVCPSASSYGDNVFSPRYKYHLANTYDSCSKGLEPKFFGCVLTSWTVHIFPWELQLACIEMLPYLAQCQNGSIDDYAEKFSQLRFGIGGDDFTTACELLSKSVLFSYTDSVGINKCSAPIAADHIKKSIAQIIQDDGLAEELQNAEDRLAEYEQALVIFNSIKSKVVPQSAYLLDIWELSSRNLINRAKAVIILLQFYGNNSVDADGRVEDVLEDIKVLRDRTYKLYQQIMKPIRCELIVGWLFDAVENELRSLMSRNETEVCKYENK